MPVYMTTIPRLMFAMPYTLRYNSAMRRHKRLQRLREAADRGEGEMPKPRARSITGAHCCPALPITLPLPVDCLQIGLPTYHFLHSRARPVWLGQSQYSSDLKPSPHSHQAAQSLGSRSANAMGMRMATIRTRQWQSSMMKLACRQ